MGAFDDRICIMICCVSFAVLSWHLFSCPGPLVLTDTFTGHICSLASQFMRRSIYVYTQHIWTGIFVPANLENRERDVCVCENKDIGFV